MQGTGGKARSVGASKDWWDVDEHTGGSVGASDDWRDVNEQTDKSEVQGSGGKACKEVGGQVPVTVCIASPEWSCCESASANESWPVFWVLSGFPEPCACHQSWRKWVSVEGVGELGSPKPV